MTTPTIEEVKALDGKIFAMLTPLENEVPDFYRKQGRKFGVSIKIANEADPEELSRARSQDHADQILMKANNRISVTVTA